MAKFPVSPLFKTASRDIQRAAARNFQNSDYGKLINEVRQAYRRPQTEQQIAGILRKYKNLSPRRALEQIAGSDFASVVRTVEQYGKRGGLPKDIIAGFLKSLGPAGNILKALAFSSKSDLGARDTISSLTQLLRAFGGEAIMPEGWHNVRDVNRGIEASIQKLQSMGYTVFKPGEEPAGRGMGPQPVKATRFSDKRRTVDLTMGTNAQQRFGRDHPIVTGAMVETPDSTNVYEFGYDYEAATLYVRYKAAAAPKERRSAPGPLYAYYAVTPEQFLAIYKTKEGGTGEWIWDNLRERGTVSGHQKDYRLVGVMGEYVPRKATLKLNPITKQKEEWYIPRMVKTQTGQWIKSRLPAQSAEPTGGFMVGERGAGGGPRSGKNSPRG